MCKLSPLDEFITAAALQSKSDSVQNHYALTFNDHSVPVLQYWIIMLFGAKIVLSLDLYPLFNMNEWLLYVVLTWMNGYCMLFYALSTA